MKSSFRILICLLAALAAVPLVAQSTSGTLVGTVTNDGAPLPGVTVTVSSPSLQGTRVDYTDTNGNYAFPNLPPGDYTVQFEMSGMANLARTTKVALSASTRVDAAMQLGPVSEAIIVTAEAPSALETPGTTANFETQFIQELPIERNLLDDGIVGIAPGVSPEGPNDQVMISGASSHQNLYLINGAVVGDNIRNQPEDLFIEDAIEETTVLTSAVSAEFGRFTGGVVSAITKSGGNEFTGSIRDSLENDSWTDLTPFEEAEELEKDDKLLNIWEATLGGRIIRDRLWFFAAGRMEEDSEAHSTLGTNIPYTLAEEDNRYEAKLTGNINSRHSLVASYLDANVVVSGDWFGNIVDLRSLKDRELPNTLLSGHYNGAISNNFFLEALFTQRNFAFVGDGANSRDLIEGTLIRDSASGRRGWSATFCGVCGDITRDNELWGVKANYFLGTSGLGSHNFVAGYEDFTELQNENNYQSGSDFRVFGQFLYQGQDVFLRVNPAVAGHRIQWWPVLNLSQTARANTTSLFINDRWDLNPRWSFNLGVRYDKNDIVDQSGVTRAEDDGISPRLAAIWDIQGNGRNRVNFSYGRYVSKVDQGVGDSASSAGSPAFYEWDYAGPAINLGDGPYLTTDQVLTQVFNWFQSVGFTDNRDEDLVNTIDVPGVNVIIPEEGLSSPHMDEYSVGYGRSLGNRGFVRGDLIMRTWGDFYADVTNHETGIVTDSLGRRSDVTEVRNTNDLEREYRGVQLQGNYKLLDRLTLGGNYTWSELEGNAEDETDVNATISTTVDSFPEYIGYERENPVGFLTGDVRHRLNLWAALDIPTPVGQFNLSLLHRFATGFPYEAIGLISTEFVTQDYGYINPPPDWQYFFSDRGEFRTEDVHRTDLGVNYALPIGKLQFFVQGDILNILNNDAIVDPSDIDLDVFTAADDPGLEVFNPFTETPVEGVHYELSETFGEATNHEGYQLARTYRVSLGLRF